MGLLDALNSRDGIFALGLLDAAAPRPVRTSLGGGLLQALGQAQAWQQNRDDREAAAEERKQRAAMQAMQQQLMQAQIGETQAQAQQRQAAVEAAQRQAAEQQRIKGLLQGALAPVAPIQANAASGVSGPRPEALNVVGSRPAVDWQQLIAQGVPAELVAKLAEAPNLGRAKAVRTVEVMGPNGPETVLIDDFGNRVGQGFAKPVELKMQDLGGKVAPLNPYTGMQVGAGLGKTNTPDALLSAAMQRRGQDLVDARSREGNQIQRDAAGKVDWKQDVNGNWIALPKEVSGAGPVTPITTTAPGKREQQAQNALGIIDEAAKLIDKGTSSYLGAGIDQAARVFGAAPAGAQAAAQLKALEGALMMAQPRMEGPQSDKDVALYRQMAAQIGDSTIPAESKKAALQVIRGLHARYSAGAGGPAQTPTAPAGFRVLGKE